MIDFSSFKDPIIRVDWEDVPTNFSNEKIKRIKAYFSEKYKTKNVVVKTIIVAGKDANAKLKTLEMNESILDSQYQKKIVKEFIKENDIKIPWDLINRLDDKVNLETDKARQNHLRHNKWHIKKIEFSNFLSFGKNNVLDFTILDGITVIESEPKNFGGKTSASVDLLLYLFFNTTTKTTKQEDVFNKYTDDNEVIVKGYLEIDGFDYVIERIISRKVSKTGTINYKTDLLFQKMNVDGQYENLSGEQRIKTEEFIKNAIGDKEDFLATILTTGSNLEELIEAKTTARGQLLTKFLGLESLKDKEEICKTMHTDWSKKKISNNHNPLDKQTEIEKKKIENDLFLKTLTDFESGLNSLKIELNNLQIQKEDLLLKKYTDVDQDLAKINIQTLHNEINQLLLKVKDLQKTHDEIEVKDPTVYYFEDKHKLAQEEVNKWKIKIQVISNEYTTLSKTIKQYKEGEICPTCKRSLDEQDHTKEITELENKSEELKSSGQSAKIKLQERETELEKWENSKKEFENYDREKLRKEKYLLEIQQKAFELKQKQDIQNRWENNKNKLIKNLEIEKQINDIKIKIDDKQLEINTYTSDIKDAQNRIDENNRKIKENKELIEKIKKEEEVDKVFKIYLWIYGKNGISKSIIKNMIPLINQEIARILADTCNFNLEISINEKNEVDFDMIDIDTRVSKSMASGSGYEKTVASLALRAVFSKISSLPKPNVIVMDEVFGKIADENLEMVGEFFLKIKSYFEHILLITHNPLIKNWSYNTLLIKKENNISSIV